MDNMPTDRGEYFASTGIGDPAVIAIIVLGGIILTIMTGVLYYRMFKR